jgi:hypothetical protein
LTKNEQHARDDHKREHGYERNSSLDHQPLRNVLCDGTLVHVALTHGDVSHGKGEQKACYNQNADLKQTNILPLEIGF